MKTIMVDIDNTICKTHGVNYHSCEPLQKIIDKINKLYDEGHIIIYWTARGTLTGTDWRELTETQLMKWGCKYNALKMGKPAYDLLIDDKSVHPDKI